MDHGPWTMFCLLYGERSYPPKGRLEQKRLLSELVKAFEAPSSLYSNREVQQLYKAAQEANRLGDNDLYHQILVTLKRETCTNRRIVHGLVWFEAVWCGLKRFGVV